MSDVSKMLGAFEQTDEIIDDGCVRRRGFMAIDKTIKLDFPMRNDLKEITDNLDRALEENDYDSWNINWEIVGLVAKTECACGRLTSKQMHMIWERYGTGA